MTLLFNLLKFDIIKEIAVVFFAFAFFRLKIEKGFESLKRKLEFYIRRIQICIDLRSLDKAVVIIITETKFH